MSAANWGHGCPNLIAATISYNKLQQVSYIVALAMQRYMYEIFSVTYYANLHGCIYQFIIGVTFYQVKLLSFFVGRHASAKAHVAVDHQASFFMSRRKKISQLGIEAPTS